MVLANLFGQIDCIDVAVGREEQRAREGFISPSAAASFLGLARVTNLHDIVDSREVDPITRAYFRAFEATPAGPPRGKKAAPPALEAADAATRLARLVEQLDEAEVPREAPQNLLAGSTASCSSEADALFKRAMVELYASHPKLHSLRMDELSYLGNVLVAGCTFAGRRLRPFEAVQAVVRGVSEALATMKGPIILIANLLTECRGMLGFTAADAVARIEEATQRKVDVVITNMKWPSPQVLSRYAQEHKEPLAPGTLPDHCELVGGEFWTGDIARHDRPRLAYAVWSVLSRRLLADS